MIYKLEIMQRCMFLICSPLHTSKRDWLCYPWLIGCSEWTALEGQDLPCMYLAHHELESVNIIVVVTNIMMIILIIMITAAGIYGVYTGVLRR